MDVICFGSLMLFGSNTPISAIHANVQEAALGGGFSATFLALGAFKCLSALSSALTAFLIDAVARGLRTALGFTTGDGSTDSRVVLDKARTGARVSRRMLCARWSCIWAAWEWSLGEV